MSVTIDDDLELLDLMISDYDGQPSVYQAGPFWKKLCRESIHDINQFGIADFRGSSSAIGWGFTDNTFHEADPIMGRHKAILSDPRTYSLLSRYKLPETMTGGCVNFVEIGGRRISSHYLNLLEQHDRIRTLANYKTSKSLFEIGGGFGVNVHLVLNNSKNICKILYLDVPPNLYIGTQYLKAFYGRSIKDYRDTRDQRVIRFHDDDSLEIIAIAPWQLVRVDEKIDIFHNAHSFVEMPEAVVRFYSEQVTRLLAPKSSVTLLSYDCYDLNTTFHPDKLPGFFPELRFKKDTKQVLDGRYSVISFCARWQPRNFLQLLKDALVPARLLA
jgi:hypothetical protein